MGRWINLRLTRVGLSTVGRQRASNAGGRPTVGNPYSKTVINDGCVVAKVVGVRHLVTQYPQNTL